MATRVQGVTYDFSALCAKVFPAQTERARKNNPCPDVKSVIGLITREAGKKRFARPTDHRTFHYLLQAGLIIRLTPGKVGRYTQIWYKMSDYAERFVHDLQMMEVRKQIALLKSRNSALVVIHPDAQQIARYVDRRMARKVEGIRRALDVLYAEHVADVQSQRSVGVPF